MSERNGRSLRIYDDNGSLSPDELRVLKRMIRAYHFSRFLFWGAVSTGTIAVAVIEVYEKLRGLAQ